MYIFSSDCFFIPFHFGCVFNMCVPGILILNDLTPDSIEDV